MLTPSYDVRSTGPIKRPESDGRSYMLPIWGIRYTFAWGTTRPGDLWDISQRQNSTPAKRLCKDDRFCVRPIESKSRTSVLIWLLHSDGLHHFLGTLLR